MSSNDSSDSESDHSRYESNEQPVDENRNSGSNESSESTSIQNNNI